MSFISTKNTFIHLSDCEEDCKDLRRSRTTPDFFRLSLSSIDTSACDDLTPPMSSVSSVRSERRVSLAEIEIFTTIMIRNIPCKYTQAQMIEEVAGVSPNFDFLYVPPARTVKVEKNLGYAFVNFRSVDDARQFIVDFQGHVFSLYKNSPKTAKVSYAELQGLQENVKFFKKSKVSKSKFRPFIATA